MSDDVPLPRYGLHYLYPDAVIPKVFPHAGLLACMILGVVVEVGWDGMVLVSVSVAWLWDLHLCISDKSPE